MRCFIGLPLPEDYQQGLRQLIAAWRPRLRSRMSWTLPGNWHLTLKFLGEVSKEALAPVIQALRRPLGERFVLQAEGGGFFSSPSRPRVLWAGIRQGGEACSRLANEIDRRCEALGFQAEGRAFSPHLTVARIKQPLSDPWPQVLQSFHDAAWPEAEIGRVVLWESSLGADGPSYKAAAEFPLS